MLLILIVLAPIQALDDVLMNGFAVFSNPRAIFFRRYVLNPVLRLAVVGLLIFGERDVEFLAVGYVVTGPSAWPSMACCSSGSCGARA